jgi:molecular chaperone DnaJ
MSQRDYYEVLGVDRNAEKSAIKKAYKKKAVKFHPDRNPDNPEAEAQFKEAAEAYEVLSDAEKRSVYDRFGHQGLQRSGYSGPGDVGDIFGGLGDIFSEFFGGGRSRSRGRGPARGDDLRVVMQMTLAEAAFGCERELDLTHPTTCGVCDGAGGDRSNCGMCDGAGQVVQSRGMFMMQTACPNCRGRGWQITNACVECQGEGEVPVERRVRVTVPAGVDAGQSLRLTGQGKPGKLGGPSGHLYVVLDVEEDPRFERHGEDLVHHLAVNFVDAAVGAQLEVPNLDAEGSAFYARVPAGAQPGTQIRIRDAGVPRLGGHGRGDLIAVVSVRVPKKVSRKTKKALLELRDDLDR